MRTLLLLSVAFATGASALLASQNASADQVLVVPGQQQPAPAQPPPPPPHEEHTTTIINPQAPAPAPQQAPPPYVVQQQQPVYTAPPPPEQPYALAPPRAATGAQVEANVGTAFNDTYNVGFGARLGFTTDIGLYLGGAVEHFIGRSVVGTPHVTFIGAELGMKFYPTSDQRLEIRPYGFLGGAVYPSANSDFAFHPGVLAAYRFGDAFVSLDGRLLATPGPTSVAMMFGAGLNF